MLFSATLDRGVDKLVDRFLSSPVRHEVDEVEAPVVAMTHHVFGVADATAKKSLVQTLASGSGRRVLFSRTKHHAKRLARDLTAAGIPAVDLHGNLSQGARTRNMDAFHSGVATTLVATDIAARGIHVDDVALVVHADPPAEHKAYLHRSGRTARAGAAGTVITLMTDEQVRDVRALTRAAGIRPTTTKVDSVSHPVLRELAPGERSAPGGLVLKSSDEQPSGRGQGGGGSRRRSSGGGRGGQGSNRSGGKPGQGAKRSGGKPAQAGAGNGSGRGRGSSRRRTASGGGSHSAASFSSGRR